MQENEQRQRLKSPTKRRALCKNTFNKTFSTLATPGKGDGKNTGIFAPSSISRKTVDSFAEKYENATVVVDTKVADFFKQTILRKTFNIVILTPAGAKEFVLEQVAVSATPLIEKHEIDPQKGD